MSTEVVNEYIVGDQIFCKPSTGRVRYEWHIHSYFNFTHSTAIRELGGDDNENMHKKYK